MSKLEYVPRTAWPTLKPDPTRFNVWKSDRFLVQAFRERRGVVRLTVCRTERDEAGRLLDGISWDELQALKSSCGYGNYDAVEVYPPDADAVTAPNHRHLWIMPKHERLQFAWRNAGAQLSLIKDMLTKSKSEEN